MRKRECMYHTSILAPRTSYFLFDYQYVLIRLIPCRTLSCFIVIIHMPSFWISDFFPFICSKSFSLNIFWIFPLGLIFTIHIVGSPITIIIFSPATTPNIQYAMPAPPSIFNIQYQCCVVSYTPPC